MESNARNKEEEKHVAIRAFIVFGKEKSMIKSGTKITIRPNKRYPNNPELNEDIAVGSDHYGDFQQCQVMDINSTSETKFKTGFFYCRIHTNIPLKIGDMVTVDKIIYFQQKMKNAIVGITIQEKSPLIYDDKVDEDSVYGF